MFLESFFHWLAHPTASTGSTAHLNPGVTIAQVLKFRILLSKENVLITRGSLSSGMR